MLRAQWDKSLALHVQVPFTGRAVIPAPRSAAWSVIAVRLSGCKLLEKDQEGYLLADK